MADKTGRPAFISFSSGGVLANTASIVTQVLTSPMNDSAIVVSDKKAEIERLQNKATAENLIKFQDVKSIIARLARVKRQKRW